MISLSAQYALRAILHIARDGRAHTADDIATVTGIPRGYLAKILNQLQRAGLIQAQRGLNGGYRFARDSEQVNALEVVRAIDTVPSFIACTQCQATKAGGACGALAFLAETSAECERRFRQTTLAQLLVGCTPGVQRL